MKRLVPAQVRDNRRGLEMIPTNKLLRSEHKRIKKYQEKDKKVIPLKVLKSTYNAIFGQRFIFE